MPFTKINNGKNKGKFKSPSGKVFTASQVKRYYAKGKRFKTYHREVDRGMHFSGEIDYEKKRIRVNPRKGDLINTIIHEETHRRNPDKSEKWVKDKSFKKESELSVGQAIKLLQKYKRGNKDA